jgi:hypothetical protein
MARGMSIWRRVGSVSSDAITWCRAIDVHMSDSFSGDGGLMVKERVQVELDYTTMNKLH